MSQKFDAIIHAGVSKTGSSSLQQYLSHNPITDKYIYCCIMSDGNLRCGTEITKIADSHYLDYWMSAFNLNEIVFSDEFIEKLESVRKIGKIPIFSNEDWYRQASIAEIKFNNIFRKVHVIFYIRPHVEWFNSAWWQWWVWDRRFSSPEDVLSSWSGKMISFSDFIKKWKNIPFVERVTVRLMNGDIIKDFINITGDSLNIFYPYGKNNVSLSVPILKAIAHLGIRLPHNPEADFRLGRHIPPVGDKPWAIGRELCELIVADARADSEALAQMLEPDQAAAMRADERWWSSDAYAGRKLTRDMELTRDECLALLESAIPAIIDLDRRLRENGVR